MPPRAPAQETHSFVDDDGATKDAPTKENEADSKQGTRPFPWNALSDECYMAMGMVILFFIIIPSMSVILLANVVGYGLQYSLYDYNPAGRAILEGLRGAQRRFFQIIGNYILLDPRDSSYLTFMVWGCIVQPYLLYWVWNRYEDSGRLEIAVFLMYHLLRVGPRHQLFAHHATLVHKEGHASRKGLFCNPFKKGRQMVSRPIRRLFTDHLNAGIAGLIYGTIPNHYATAHNKIHHRWHNDTGDVHTNMDFDRTILSSYVMYLPRFVAYWTGISPLILFYSRGEYKFFWDLVFGMIYYYSWSALVCYKAGFVFYWAYVLYPFLEGASFLGIIAYLWHSFSEESDPNNQYINSITILRGGNNIWNEDYHVVHHHEPGVHWSDMPQSFEQNLQKYVDCRATVFGDCEQGMLIAWIFGAKWDDLANHYIDLQYVFSTGEKNCAVDKRLTVKQVAEYERALARQVCGEEKEDEASCKAKSEVELLAHHEEVKDMLLRRLRYHYLGDRKDEWGKFNATLDANVRIFDDKEKSN